MTKLPDVSGKELIKALQRGGFKVIRQSGSHALLEKNTLSKKYITTVPIHSNRSLKKGTLSDILRQTGFSKEELSKLL